MREPLLVRAAQFDDAPLLDAATAYALQIVVACGRLYHFAGYGFAGAYGLDAPFDADSPRRPWRGAPHHRVLVSAAAIERLRALGLVRVRDQAIVAHAKRYAIATNDGLLLGARYGWPTISRQWNEMPLYAMQTGAPEDLFADAPL